MPAACKDKARTRCRMRALRKLTKACALPDLHLHQLCRWTVVREPHGGTRRVLLHLELTHLVVRRREELRRFAGLDVDPENAVGAEIVRPDELILVIDRRRI